MSSPDLHRVLLHPLHLTGLDYMVTGAVAAIAYGEPRLTNDVYLVVRLEPGDAETLISAFTSPEYYVPPLEILEEGGSALATVTSTSSIMTPRYEWTSTWLGTTRCTNGPWSADAQHLSGVMPSGSLHSST